jgi:hypothetical protein
VADKSQLRTKYLGLSGWEKYWENKQQSTQEYLVNFRKMGWLVLEGRINNLM